MFTAAFWRGLGERALSTFLQAFTGALATSIVAAATGINGALGVEAWKLALFGSLSTAVIATVLSIAKSFGNADFTAGAPADTPVDTVPVEPVEPNQPDPNDGDSDTILSVEPQAGDDHAAPVG